MDFLEKLKELMGISRITGKNDASSLTLKFGNTDSGGGNTGTVPNRPFRNKNKGKKPDYIYKVEVITPDATNQAINFLSYNFTYGMKSNNKKDLRFLEGISHYLNDDYDEAAKKLAKDDSPDSKFLLAIIAVKKNNIDTAINYLAQISDSPDAGNLGSKFKQFGIPDAFRFYITPEIEIQANMDAKNALMYLAKTYQSRGMYNEAITSFQKAYFYNPKDKVLLLGYLDLLYSMKDTYHENLTTIISLTKDIAPDTIVDAGILYYRALALLETGKYNEAKNILWNLIAKKHILNGELEKAVREVMDTLPASNVS